MDSLVWRRENTGGGESSSKVLADSRVRLNMNGEKRLQNEEWEQAIAKEWQKWDTVSKIFKELLRILTVTLVAIVDIL